MNCTEITSTLDDYLDGELDVTVSRAIESHIAECDACAAEAGRHRVLRHALSAYPMEAVAADFADRAIEHAASHRSKRKFPRLAAAGFVAAFAASVLTVIYTGLLVEAPRTELVAGLPTVTMSLEQSQVVNLVFASAIELDGVTLLVDLPRGIELAGYAGQSRVEWSTNMSAGRNILPLELVAHSTTGGQLIAQLGHGDQSKVFRVHLDIAPMTGVQADGPVPDQG
jgi:hypothetical protein